MPNVHCVGGFCLEAGPWFLVLAGVFALLAVLLGALGQGFTALGAAVVAFVAFLKTLIRGIAFMVLAGAILFALYCAITGTWQHIHLPW